MGLINRFSSIVGKIKKYTKEDIDQIKKEDDIIKLNKIVNRKKEELGQHIDILA